jgi:hypothetical protein
MAFRINRLRLGAPLSFLLCFAAAGQVATNDHEQLIPLQVIVTATSAEAHSILNRIRNGEDFTLLARQYSTDPTALVGGYLGTVSLSSLAPTLKGALSHAKPGGITDIVQTVQGYSILKVLNAPLPDDITDTNLQHFLAVEGIANIRLTAAASGYEEFYQAIRNEMPDGPSFQSWGRNLKAVCATRQEAPRYAIAALQNVLATGAESMDTVRRAYTEFTLAELYSSQADFSNSVRELEQAYQTALSSSKPDLAQHIEEVLGLAHLHRSLSADPAVPSAANETLLFPMHPGPLHTQGADATKAARYFTQCLKRDPSNQGLRWLLNLAYMTAGEYPTHVPDEFLIPPSVFTSKEDLGLFTDVAPAAGLATYGNAGGAIVDDFDNDGLLDVVVSQVDDCEPLRYFHNNGDGTFTNRAKAAGLSDQTGGLNMIQADYNDDGCVDILVLRGGWEFPRRRSLLRNNCNGTFTDVTEQSGLLNGPLASSQSAVWADIDNDGHLDLFVANENAPSQLFLNKGDGTFVDISHESGVDRTAFSKAVVSADYDGDGYPDFYVSNYNGPNFLYHNNRNRTFSEVSGTAGVREPWMSFGAWFFDYDNDGWPDLCVTSYFMSLDEVARSYLGMSTKQETLKLYRNMRNGTFQDVTKDVELDRVFMPMGANFGDIDNDGFLDIYLGVGNPSYASVMPNVLLHNQEGKRFTDITTSSGTGALSKGHGVAFADLNNDGNEDIFVVMGGPHPGDRFPSRLFKNPGKHGNDWISLRLVGVKSNRGAMGARIAVTVENDGQRKRTIWRTVGSGGSFGASPLQQHIGLGKTGKIEKVEVWWPVSRTTQTFTNVAPNQFYEIKEFGTGLAKVERHSFALGGPSRGGGIPQDLTRGGL